jgi:hypothetical protein
VDAGEPHGGGVQADLHKANGERGEGVRTVFVEMLPREEEREVERADGSGCEVATVAACVGVRAASKDLRFQSGCARLECARLELFFFTNPCDVGLTMWNPRPHMLSTEEEEKAERREWRRRWRVVGERGASLRPCLLLRVFWG